MTPACFIIENNIIEFDTEMVALWDKGSLGYLPRNVYSLDVYFHVFDRRPQSWADGPGAGTFQHTENGNGNQKQIN